MKMKIALAAMTLGTLAMAAEGVEGAYVHPKCKAMVQQKVKMHKKKAAHSPFLITQGLPHLTKKVKMFWDDKELNLSDEQKAKLLEVRKATIGTIKAVKPKVTALQGEIVAQIKAGESADALAPKVKELAELKAEATMAHLKCLEKTKAILTKDQLFYLMSVKPHKKTKGQPKAVFKTTPQTMKCAPGKCAHGK